MRIRFADISEMLRVADPRSGARLCEAQHAQSMRMPINRIGMVQTYRAKWARTSVDHGILLADRLSVRRLAASGGSHGDFKNGSRRREEAVFGAKNTSASSPDTAFATILESALDDSRLLI